MKNKIILGTLVFATVMQAAVPAIAQNKNRNDEVVGGIIGGVIGGIIGGQNGNNGNGKGNPGGAIVGAIIGAIIGSQVGGELQDGDRRAMEDAQRRGLQGRVGTRVDWDGRNYGSFSGARGTFQTTREGYNQRTGDYCREYVNTIYLRNRNEQIRGIACMQRNGSWYEARSNDVYFDGGNRPPTYPGPGNPRPPQPPPYPTPYPPSQGRYEGSAQVSQVSRKTGGEWLRVTLRRPASLESLQIRALSFGVKIHEASFYTEGGRTVRIRELSPTGTFYAGNSVYSESLSNRERIQVIDIRAESMGGAADLRITAVASDQAPSLSISRF